MTPLTGLLRRDVFIGLADYEIQAASGMSALLFIDLDRFKDINDQLGHRAGDKVLRDTAQRITRQVRYRDLVGRLAGDEMVLLLLDINREVAEEIASRINGALQNPTASIGLLLLQSPGKTEDFLDVADQLMYEAKRDGGNRYITKMM